MTLRYDVTVGVRSNHLQVEGTDCPRPIVDFNEAGLDSDISQRLRQLGYEVTKVGNG